MTIEKSVNLHQECVSACNVFNKLKVCKTLKVIEFIHLSNNMEIQ